MPRRSKFDGGVAQVRRGEEPRGRATWDALSVRSGSRLVRLHRHQRRKACSLKDLCEVSRSDRISRAFAYVPLPSDVHELRVENLRNQLVFFSCASRAVRIWLYFSSALANAFM